MKNKVRVTPEQYREFQLIYQNAALDLKIFEINDFDYVMYDPLMMKVSSGQIALRDLINKNFRPRINPWCFISNQNDRSKPGFGQLTHESVFYWEFYSVCPKLIAFQHGMLVGSKIVGVDWRQFAKHDITDFSSIVVKGLNTWWNMQNVDSELIELQSNDELIMFNPLSESISHKSSKSDDLMSMIRKLRERNDSR